MGTPGGGEPPPLGVPAMVPLLRGRCAAFAACGVAHVVVFLQNGAMLFWGKDQHVPVAAGKMLK